MILYHGSNVKAAEIGLEKCRPFKDFGRGFYLTEIEGQAVQMAERVARLYGGLPVVSKFALDEAICGDESLRIMKFDEPNRDWALFIINSRDRNFADVSNALCNQDGKYDMAFGAVANDGIV